MSEIQKKTLVDVVDPEDYFSKQLPVLLDSKCEYYMIYGERSNGKTYALLEHGLKEYFKKGHEFAYIRRWQEDLRGANGKQIFNGIVDSGVVKKLSNGKWDEIYYYSRAWYLAKWNKNKNGEKVLVKDVKPFCYAFALNEAERYKSTSYPNIKTIIFDEFLTKSNYMVNEFSYFMSILSTIIRNRDDVTVYMLGNTVNIFSPYFEEFGLYRTRQMEQGDFDVYTYGNSPLKVGVYWAPDFHHNGATKPSDKYFAFNDSNSNLAMIRGGKWEFDMYPHIDWSIRPKDIVFKCFIKYCEYIIQVNVCIHDGKNYIYCHWKTTPIKDEDRDIVMCVTPDPRPNWRVGFGADKIGRAIRKYFVEDKVFYQSNMVGETIKNYLTECK